MKFNLNALREITLSSKNSLSKLSTLIALSFAFVFPAQQLSAGESHDSSKEQPGESSQILTASGWSKILEVKRVNLPVGQGHIKIGDDIKIKKHPSGTIKAIKFKQMTFDKKVTHTPVRVLGRYTVTRLVAYQKCKNELKEFHHVLEADLIQKDGIYKSIEYTYDDVGTDQCKDVPGGHGRGGGGGW